MGPFLFIRVAMVRRRPAAAAAVTLGALLAAAGCGSIRDADVDGAAPADADADGGLHRGMVDAADDGVASGDAVVGDAAVGDLVADLVADMPADACTIKINEVQTGGAAAAGDEFIELYNTCPSRQVPLANHRLVYRSATGTADVLLFAFASETIAANQPYFLCASTTYSGTASKDVVYSNNIAAAGGGIALLSPDGSAVDAVGWGTALNAYVETAPAAAPPAGSSIARVPDGHDSNDNLVDFMVTATPTPRAHN
jgi:hypothetical protein